MQSISGAATISSIDVNARVSPMRRSRAKAAVASACAGFGLQIPRTSASRTASHDWRWKRVMKPLPTNPTPSVLRVLTRSLRSLAGASVAGGQRALGRGAPLAEREREDERAHDRERARNEEDLR